MNTIKLIFNFKKAIIIVAFFLCSLSSYATKEIPDSLDKYMGYAVELMDNGNYDESISILNEVIKIAPQYYVARYELGFAYFLKKDYSNTIKTLRKVEKHPLAKDLLFHMLGRAYDITGNSKKAIDAYNKGLKKFPSSGRNYFGLGSVYEAKKEYELAILNYEKGIDVDPLLPPNYLMVSNMLCQSREKVYGIMYGEIFINLMPDTDEAKYMSKLLYNTYKEAISFKSDTVTILGFTARSAITKGTNLAMPFEVFYETYGALSSWSIVKAGEVNLISLNAFRTDMINTIVKNAKSYKNVLFRYHEKIKEAGHFEAYNMWLLSEGSPGEFNGWMVDNEQKYIAFMLWHKDNPLVITHENRFSRYTALDFLAPK